MRNKIIFGITGSVSAVKAISLIRIFIKNGVECRAIVTEGGLKFIKPELLVALGCNVYTDESLNMYSYEQSMSHINLSRWADKICIIPASANIIAKLSHGFADDLLSQCILANNQYQKVYIAPSMNVNMWRNVLTQKNVKKLQNLGFNLISPDHGLQACGDIGRGRLHEPDVLFKLLSLCNKDFKDKKVLVTVGATVEDIDGVRYLSNYSSGKMGLALVEELLNRGAQVTVLKAKTSIKFDINHNNLDIYNTISADDMNKIMLEQAKTHNVFIGCAAVADYKIKNKFANKLKKRNKEITLEFIRNPDILENCKKNYPNIFVIGFAAESQNIIEYAKKKLIDKNLNMIVANSISVFDKEESSVTIISKQQNKEYFNKTKSEIAKFILDFTNEII